MKTNPSKKLTTDASLLKQINFARILSLLRYHPRLTRAEIARRTGLTRSTVTVITAELMATGLLREGNETASGAEGGRPGIELELDPAGAFFVGVAIGVEEVRVVELNLAAQVTARVQAAMTTDTHPATVTQQVADLIEQVWQANPQSKARSRGVGITVPSTLNREGIILRAPGLHWQGVDLRRYLNLHLDVPLFIENDANAGALVEMYLSGSMPSHSLLYLLLDVGIGGGMVLNNRLLRGAGGTASEVSELMIDPSRQQAARDRSGTLGALCGKSAVLSAYRQQSGEAIDLDTLRSRLAQADPIAQAVVQQWGTYLSWGVRGLVGVLNPERVVFGGQLTVLVPFVQSQLDEMLQDCLPDSSGYRFDSAARFRLRVSKFGADAAAIGGAAVAYQSLFQVPDLVLLQQ